MFKFNILSLRRVCTNVKRCFSSEELNIVKQLDEYKIGLSALAEGKFNEAEYHIKKCLIIFKNVNQTHTVSYIHIMKKFSEILFYNKKLEECEKTMKASVELAKEIFKNNREMTFPYYRNLIAFYTYTDIDKASYYVDQVEAEFENKSKVLSFASGAIKLLNNECTKSKQKMNETVEAENIPIEIKAFNLHNMAVFNMEMKRDLDLLGEEEKKKFIAKFNLNSDVSILEKESLVFYKQALAILEESAEKVEKGEKITLNTELKQFLFSSSEIPKSEIEETIADSFKYNKSGLTITNISEMFFEKGAEHERQTAFWLKTGLKHYEKYEKENIARHLIIFSLFYSQLGQSMYAEGLYRKAIEMLRSNIFSTTNYNLIFALNMYGRLLLRQPKREKEANELLEQSESFAKSLPFWYGRMCRTRILDFDFE